MKSIKYAYQKGFILKMKFGSTYKKSVNAIYPINKTNYKTHDYLNRCRKNV